MFEANRVESDTSDLNSDGALTRSSCIDLVEVRLFDYEFFHRSFGVLIPLLSLFCPEFGHLKRSENCGDR